MKKRKRQPRTNNSKARARVDFKDLKIEENTTYAFFEGKQKKSPCFTGEVTGIVGDQSQKCIVVAVKSCKKEKNLIGKTITLSYVPSKQMWHLLKENKGTGKVYELKKAA